MARESSSLSTRLPPTDAHLAGLSTPRAHTHQVIGSIVGLIALIAIGVGVGVGVSKSRSNSSSKTSSGSSDSVVNQTDPNDPSTFQLDSRLKKSFYGIAYTPEGSQLPDCGNSLGAFSRSTLTVEMLRTTLTRVLCRQSKSLRISRYSSGLFQFRLGHMC